MATNTKIKLCVDCKHYKNSSRANLRDDSYQLCSNENLINPVNGEPWVCSQARLLCGYEQPKYWERRRQE